MAIVVNLPIDAFCRLVMDRVDAEPPKEWSRLRVIRNKTEFDRHVWSDGTGWQLSAKTLDFSGRTEWSLRYNKKEVARSRGLDFNDDQMFKTVGYAIDHLCRERD